MLNDSLTILHTNEGQQEQGGVLESYRMYCNLSPVMFGGDGALLYHFRHCKYLFKCYVILPTCI